MAELEKGMSFLAHSAAELEFVERSARATFIRSKRIADSTRKTYASYVRRFKEYIEQKYPSLVDNSGNIKLECLNINIMDNFFTQIGNGQASGIMDSPDDEKNECEPLATMSVLNNFRSAIRSMFVDKNIKVPEWYDKELSPLFQGFKKEWAKLDRDGIRVVGEEGKAPFSFSIYRLVMMCAFKSNPFAHLFGLLCWNLMARGDNVEDINLNNLGWNEDALTIRFGHAKNDQTGEKSISTEVRHVYANPITPSICPILSLAVFLSCCFSAPSDRLFIGKRQKDRMLHNIHSILQEDETQQRLLALGVKPTHYGNHSFRKGSSTFVSSGSVGGPSVISVIRRAGWSMGDVLGRYLKADAAGDQYVGRAACGLPISSPSFAVLPPHFQGMSSEDQAMVR
jgi:hypothetical protein